MYAFFHTALPDEPLVVLHTALVHSVARSMLEILPQHAVHQQGRGNGGAGWSGQRAPPERTWEERQAWQAQHAAEGPGLAGGAARSADGASSRPPRVAVFYSISSTQPGLSGVDLGNFLIKQVLGRGEAAHAQLTSMHNSAAFCHPAQQLRSLPGCTNSYSLLAAKLALQSCRWRRRCRRSSRAWRRCAR